MHSWHGETHNFLFNGDFSGKIKIYSKDNINNGIDIESDELLEFFTYNYIQDRIIEKIENMDYKELLEHLISK